MAIFWCVPTFFVNFGDSNWRQAEAWIVLLAGAVEVNALAKERYGNSLNYGSNTQPSNWEADTFPLNYCRSHLVYLALLLQPWLYVQHVNVELTYSAFGQTEKHQPKDLAIVWDYLNKWLLKLPTQQKIFLFRKTKEKTKCDLATRAPKKFAFVQSKCTSTI